ncbi:MAG: winged helix-turn-helix domain-containing protein [Proteobacteria bacterium]|nr:winged helix-turn-helix domain-containing protein [Pseudomonadota bacterium]
MIYRFDQFELDTEKLELRGDGGVIALEPQVFALLAFLVENRDRVVSKDEIVEKIWEGRIVSDSAVSSRIKSARQALGDDGVSQRFIRTMHRIGFRFVADVVQGAPRAIASNVREPQAASPIERASTLDAMRPTIAVLPFRLVGIAGPYATIADALPDELITQLSRLRWLFVIARGSSFRFRNPVAELARIRTALNVRYCLSGVVEVRGKTLSVAVELADTHDSGVVWGEAFHIEVDGVHQVREEIVQAIINALELQIPLNEARHARWKAPEQLDAWSAYHLGLQHAFRFNKADNEAATALFRRAVDLEPTFARGYAGLSFTRFQDAFLHYDPNVEAAADDARRCAERSLEYDPMDPFANFTMGRSFWLKGDLESSLPWLDRANTLNPNYAQGRYARAFTDPMLGEGLSGQAYADAAMALSPLDPLLYAMQATRAFSHVVRGELDDAVLWIDRARRSPGAHVLIDAIGAVVHGLRGDDAQARQCAATARSRDPSLRQEDFFRAFPFRSALMRKQFAEILTRYGF